jgi:uncharacterized membrane protein
LNVLILVLRLVHIVAGVFWVGGALLITFFLTPAVGAAGEAGQKVMQQLVGKVQLTARMTAASVLTVLAGAILYWIDSHGFTSPWTTSGAGLGFGIGAVFALIGFGFGAMVGRTAKAIAKVAAQAGGKPGPDQLSRMQALQQKMGMYGLISSTTLIVAVVCMATARYWLL